jgi:hypothetical protein
MNKTTRLIQLFAIMGILLVLTATPASAALARCRVDPIFILSNGDSVAVTSEVFTDPSRISYITYTLHVPPGVTVKQVIHTAQGLGIKEVYRVYQNSPAGVYSTDTVVTTSGLSKVAVIVYTRLNGLPVRTVSGYSGQHLVAIVSRLPR